MSRKLRKFLSFKPLSFKLMVETSAARSSARLVARRVGLLAMLLASLVVAGTASVQAQAKDKPRGLFAEDLVSLRRLSDPQISPDGQQLAFVLRIDGAGVSVNGSANGAPKKKRQAGVDIWLLDLRDNRLSRRLTTSAARDFQPRWSVDGEFIYFLSDRSGLMQVWKLPVDGGEARQVSNFPVSVSNLAISPAGDRMAFSANVYPACDTLLCTATKLEAAEASAESGLAYDRLIVRYWDQWRDGRQNHLFTASLDDQHGLITEAFDVSGSLSGDVPEKPFGSTDAFAFSADGQSIFFALKVQDENESWSLNSDIYAANAYGRGRTGGRTGGRTNEPANLTENNPAIDKSPIVSGDGKWLAWLATEGPKRYAAERKIKLMDLSKGGGEVRTLAADWDRSPDAISFSADSKSILARASHLGTKALFNVSLRGGAPKVLIKGGAVGRFASLATGRGQSVVYSFDDLSRPADLYQLEVKSGQSRQLTSMNADKLKDITMAEYKQFSFAGADGDTVYGYVMKPADFNRKKTYPVALIIHGGPHGSMGNRFHYRWNPQVYAANGYATVFIDFHGSVGYGQAFVESIMGDRGGKTLDDQKLGLAAALDQFSWLDGEKVCAVGASFGGYMVNWIAGAWPDRFRCLINHDGMFDNRMKYYAGDIIGYLEEGFGGTYFDNPEAHEKFNPARLVSEWQTPMLVIHGGRDYRVPETQGLGAFTALQRRGIPSRLLYFPDENHWVQNPANSIQWHREVFEWLDRWLLDE